MTPLRFISDIEEGAEYVVTRSDGAALLRRKEPDQLKRLDVVLGNTSVMTIERVHGRYVWTKASLASTIGSVIRQAVRFQL